MSSYENMIKLWDSLNNVYYATSEDIELGKVLIVKESKIYPKYFICNPNDFDKIQFEATSNLVHIRDYK